MANNDFLISIIIPVYNAETYLNTTIASVLNQVHHKIELILVDDGSTDSSADICNKFVGIDQRIKYYKQCNSGANAARGFGLRHAEGEYIYFLDADDTIGPNEISSLLTELHGADVLISGCKSNFLYNRDEYLKAIFNNSIPINLCGNLYRRTKLKEEFFLTGKKVIMGEDMLSNLMIAGEIQSIRGTYRSEYYISNTNSTSLSRSFKRSMEYELNFIKMVTKILDNIQNINTKEELLIKQKFGSLKFLIIEDRKLDINNRFIQDLFNVTKNPHIQLNFVEKCILSLKPNILKTSIFRYYLLFRRRFNL